MRISYWRYLNLSYATLENKSQLDLNAKSDIKYLNLLDSKDTNGMMEKLLSKKFMKKPNNVYNKYKESTKHSKLSRLSCEGLN